MKLALDQMTLQPGAALVNFAQTVKSVSRTLKTVFGVVQSLANVSTVGGAVGGSGLRKLRLGAATVPWELAGVVLGTLF